jgi:hypothetical protein
MSRLATLFVLALSFGSYVRVQSDETAVPQVLCLVDSFQKNQVVTPAGKELKGKAKMVFPKVEVYDTGSALERIEEILDSGEWDMIYLSFGLGDLFYKDPGTREIRAMSKFSGGVRVTSPEQYEENLSRLTRRLRATGAKVIWGHTTPLISGETSKGPYRNFQENLFDGGSPADYNAIASRVMKREEIPIVDLHRHVMEHFEGDERHPPFNGYAKALSGKKAPLHTPLVEEILEVLDR